MVWQEELDVIEQQHKKLEDALDTKSSQLLKLRKAAVQQTRDAPNDALDVALMECDSTPEPQSTPQEISAMQIQEDTSSETESPNEDSGTSPFTSRQILMEVGAINGGWNMRNSLSTERRNERPCASSWT